MLCFHMPFEVFPEAGTNGFSAFVAYLDVAEACGAAALTSVSASV